MAKNFIISFIFSFLFFSTTYSQCETFPYGATMRQVSKIDTTLGTHNDLPILTITKLVYWTPADRNMLRTYENIRKKELENENKGDRRDTREAVVRLNTQLKTVSTELKNQVQLYEKETTRLTKQYKAETDRIKIELKAQKDSTQAALHKFKQENKLRLKQEVTYRKEINLQKEVLKVEKTKHRKIMWIFGGSSAILITLAGFGRKILNIFG